MFDVFNNVMFTVSTAGLEFIFKNKKKEEEEDKETMWKQKLSFLSSNVKKWSTTQ